MKTKPIITVLFLLTAALHLAVPYSMIRQQERILTEGVAFKFKTRPVDPYDPARGRYVALQFEENSIPMPSTVTSVPWRRGENLYATLETGEDGFAKLTALSKFPPVGVPYVKVKYSYYNYGKGKILHCSVTYPFDRFYMDEYKAPKAELITRRTLEKDEPPTYALVRVLNGEGRIENLYAKGIPIGEVVQMEEDKKKE